MNFAEHYFRRTGPAKYAIRDFPVEILQMIFKHLSTKDKKAVKLVRKSWFEICNQLSFSDQEVLNCLGLHQLSDTYELVDRSERGILNLKFDAVKFDGDLSFWKKNGPRIRSITFQNCLFCGALGKIIGFCENLIHLSFIFTRTSFWHSDGKMCLSEDLAWLVENGITRENLDSLEFYNDLHEMVKDDILDPLFSIFPKVKVLKLRLNDRRHSSLSNFNSVLDYLRKSTDRIEKLMLDITGRSFMSSDILRHFTESINALSRLTELSLKLDIFDNQKVIDEFLLSKPLKSLVRNRSSLSSTSTFLSQLLRSNSNLEHLETFIGYGKNFIATKDILHMAVSSGLKRFKISTPTTSSYLEVSPEIGPSASPIPAIKVFSTDQYRMQEPFFPYFRNLLHLKLDRVSCAELQSLLKYQTSLKSLVLIGIRHFDQNQITFPEGAFDHLNDLEHLELRDRAAYTFLKSLTGESIFRNMKYVKIVNYPGIYSYRFGNKISAEDYLKLADAAPCLEALFLWNVDKTIKIDLVQLCTKLNRLRFLREDNFDYDHPPECIQKVFSSCPSLRVLYQKHDLYFFDVLSKKFTYKNCKVKDRTYVPYTFAKPCIAGHDVDWIVI